MQQEDSPEIVAYDASDGTRASMRVFRADVSDRPVAVCIPAMGVCGSYYTPFAQALRRAGLHVTTCDLRGAGSSSVRATRNCDFGYKEIIEIDMPALIAAVRNQFPNNRRIIVGHCLGGQMGALYLSTCEEAAHGIVLVASSNLHYRGWPLLMWLPFLAMVGLFRALGAMLGYVPTGRVGFAGNEGKRTIVDWSNSCLTGDYLVCGSDHDYERSLNLMRKPVLAISFELDLYGPPRAVANLLCKLRCASVTHREFSRHHAGLENADHFTWSTRPLVMVETTRG